LTRLLLLLMLAAPLWQDQRYVLSVDVDLVNVSVNAIDASGRPIEGLAADDFQVFEDGLEQKLSFFAHDARVPVSIGALIDVSGSLQDKIRQGLQTVNEIAAGLTAKDEMFVIAFNSHAEVRQKFTNEPEQIQRSLRNIRTGGETAVYDAISLGLAEMKAAKNKKRVLLLLSDCFDTRSKIKADQTEAMLKNSDALVYAIGLDDDDNDPQTRKRPRYHIYEYMLNKLTSASGGRLIRIYSTHDYDLRRLADGLLGELRQEYTMGYYPADRSQDSRLRNIEVRVSRPGVRVFSEKLRLKIDSGTDPNF
jgi:Ca-activated chloride channel homolog